MALVILVRHGQTAANVDGRIAGQGDEPLNARGQEQAQAAAEVLAALGEMHLFSSPVLRARQTAEILAQRLRVDIEEVADLREVGYGDWEGKFFRDVRGEAVAQQVFRDPVSAVFPNGESLLAVQQRGVQVIEELRRRHAQGTVVLISHGDILRTVLAHYLGMPFNAYRRLHLETGSLSVLELFDDWTQVKAVNYVPRVGALWRESFYPTWKRAQQPLPSAS